MPMPSRSTTTPWLALFFALCGLVWCGYVAFPTANPLPCSTSGCSLYRELRFGGISLWWVGGAYFFLLTIICLRGNRSLARGLAGLALFFDALLLLVMFLTAPCFDCLVVAALLGLSFVALRPESPSEGGMFPEEAKRSLLLPIWFGLFLGNSVLAAEEQVPPYALGNPATAEVRLYFSPSCPACRQALLTLGDRAALYPVEEQAGDLEAIARLAASLEAGAPLEDALEVMDDPEAMSNGPLLLERALLAAQLLRNKAVIWRQGFRALPLILINGMPRLELAPGPGEDGFAPGAPEAGEHGGPAPLGQELPWNGQTPLPGSSAQDVLPDFLRSTDALQQCGGPDGRPCD